MAKLTEKQAELFRGRNWGTVTTLRADGTPHSTPVWVDTDGENVVFNTVVVAVVVEPEGVVDRLGQHCRGDAGAAVGEEEDHLEDLERAHDHEH